MDNVLSINPTIQAENILFIENLAPNSRRVVTDWQGRLCRKEDRSILGGLFSAKIAPIARAAVTANLRQKLISPVIVGSEAVFRAYLMGLLGNLETSGLLTPQLQQDILEVAKDTLVRFKRATFDPSTNATAIKDLIANHDISLSADDMTFCAEIALIVNMANDPYSPKALDPNVAFSR